VVNRGNGEVAALEGGLVAEVAAFFFAAGVPRCLDGVDLVERALRGRLELDVVEDVELSLGSEECGVGNAVEARYASAFSATPRGSRW